MPEFAHLHVASSYSLRYGMAPPAVLAARAAQLGMPALALTDRDGLWARGLAACGPGDAARGRPPRVGLAMPPRIRCARRRQRARHRDRLS